MQYFLNDAFSDKLPCKVFLQHHNYKVVWFLEQTECSNEHLQLVYPMVDISYILDLENINETLLSLESIVLNVCNYTDKNYTHITYIGRLD